MNTKTFTVHLVTEFTGETLDDVHKKIIEGEYPLPRITKVEVDYRT